MINKRFIWIILLVLTINKSFSQDYDLIITVKNDSIACFIDSISAEKIFFEMKLNRNWIHTYSNKNQVAEYQLKSISKKTSSFRQGSSYLVNPATQLINQMHRNIVFGSGTYLLYHYSTTLNYERIIYVNEVNKKIWSFRGGYGIIDSYGKIVFATMNSLAGKTENKFEMNFGASYINEPHSYGPNYVSLVVSAGYRKQDPRRRIIFRTGAGIPEGLYMSLGYSF